MPDRAPMMLVIFGAGASFDSADRNRMPLQGIDRPPLAGDLVHERFSNIAAGIPECLPAVDHLRSRMTAGEPWSLERELAILADSSQNAPERRQHLMAFRFYLHRVIEESVGQWSAAASGFTWYLRLLHRLYEWRRQTGAKIRLATFNYDLLIEGAARAVVVGWDFSSTASYAGRDDFRLFKLHGSTNWSRIAYSHDNYGGSNIQTALEFARGHDVTTGPIEARKVNVELEVARRSPAPAPWEITIPALAVPMENKTTFECPPELVNELRAELPAVTHVLVIGWRAAEAHAVRLLQDEGDPELALALMPGYKLAIVSGDQAGADETLGNLGQVARKGRHVFTEVGGFTGFTGFTVRLQRGDFDDFFEP